ncbi:hypothetical protein JQ561_14740 [Bradyrhizobium diazoefficiens]|nr:hypothetical protein [Bradyrhizobium diazoefficiens]MBR0927866.1 hypothetical protein [Bradyrhizobium diazoefficiens]
MRSLLFLTIVLVLQHASPARSESEAERVVHREGRVLFDEGHDAYRANDYKTALRKFQQSRIKYIYRFDCPMMSRNATGRFTPPLAWIASMERISVSSRS